MNMASHCKIQNDNRNDDFFGMVNERVCQVLFSAGVIDRDFHQRKRSTRHQQDLSLQIT